MNVDLLIIGASFAGLACAKEAVQSGLSVAILEKKANSGDKLHTTGIFVKEAIEQCTWLHNAPKHLFRRIEKVRLYAPNMRQLDLHAPGYYFITTQTPALLNWMADDVRSAGVQLLSSTLFKTAKQMPDGLWQVLANTSQKETDDTGENKEITARYLIGADGPSSKVARELGLSSNTKFLYGVENEYEKANFDTSYLHCFLDKNLATGYIGWALASQGYSQIGLAKRLHGTQLTTPVNLDAFLEKIAPVVQAESPPEGTRAGLIPCGGTLQHIARPNAMLIGDAAGTVSPVTAGGIHSALLYGQQAGQAVADYLHGYKNDPAQWLIKTYPKYRLKRVLRTGFDYAQSDWFFNYLLSTSLFRRFAEQIYFHRKGIR